MVVPTDPIEPTRETIEAAAAWQAQMADEQCDDRDRAAFRAWIGGHPSRRLAYDRMTAIGAEVESSAPATPERGGRLHHRSNRLVPAILLLGALAASAWWSAGQPDVRARLADARTVVGEIEEVAAGTGDRVTLDSESAADIGERSRRILLWRGGLMADVRSGLPAPFVVQTPQGTARALGTRFSVRTDGGATVIRVIESRVEACASQGDRACLTLAAGQSARLDAAGARYGDDVDPARESAWASGLLITDDRPLGSVIDELNRYRRNKIRYAESDIAGLHLSGTLPLTDTERALKSISAALPVTVEPTPEGPVIRRR